MKNVLLIVDDMPDVARALKRCLAKSFDLVLVAQSPEEAERLLGDQDNPPTHLVCDHHLGEGQRLGADLISEWRRAYPSLQVAVLLTGSEVAYLLGTDGVDWVASKQLDIWELERFLRVGPSRAAAR